MNARRVKRNVNLLITPATHRIVPQAALIKEYNPDNITWPARNGLARQLQLVDYMGAPQYLQYAASVS